MDGGSLLVADAGAPVDSDDQAWGVPATSPVPLTSVSMASSSAGLIDPSMTSAIAQPMAAATVQPLASPLAAPQIKL